MAFDPVINLEIGRRVRALREERRFSRERLAEKADISVQFLADIEMGRKGMTVQTCRNLVLALDCSADFLLFGALAGPSTPNTALAAKVLTLSAPQAALASKLLEVTLEALPGGDASPAGSAQT